MRTADLVSAGLWLAIALGITASGWELGLGSLMEPGSGFMIFWVGALMSVLCLVVLAAAPLQAAGRGLAGLWDGLAWWKIPYAAVLLLMYAWLLPWVGFPVVTVLLLLILFKTIEPQSWTVAIIGALISTIIAYLVFDRWLGTQLPVGELFAS